MPELPEVETVRRGLAPVMEGRLILAAEARRPNLRWPLPRDLGPRLAGAAIGFEAGGVRYEGRVEGDAMIGSAPAGWRAVRVR